MASGWAQTFSDATVRRKLKLVGLVALAFVVVDQITKWIAVQSFEPAIRVIPGFFDLVFVKNEGAAFGLFAGMPEGARVPFFVVVSLAAVGMVCYLAINAAPDQKMLLVSLGMVLGGAIGNLIDRVRQGYVVDFLDFYVPHDAALDVFDGLIRLLGRTPSLHSHHYPAFNVADIGITVGVAMLLLDAFLSDRRAKKAEAGQAAAKARE